MKTQREDGRSYHQILHTKKLNEAGTQLDNSFYGLEATHPMYNALVELHNYESIYSTGKKEQLVTLNGEHTGYWIGKLPNNGGIVEWFLGYSSNRIVRKWHISN